VMMQFCLDWDDYGLRERRISVAWSVKVASRQVLCDNLSWAGMVMLDKTQSRHRWHTEMLVLRMFVLINNNTERD
jgi:hypothetical protein